MMNWLEPYSRIELVDERIAKGVDETHLNDVQAGGLAGRLTCDRAGRQNGTHHRETQSALQTLVMEDDHQIAFNSQAIRYYSIRIMISSNKMASGIKSDHL